VRQQLPRGVVTVELEPIPVAAVELPEVMVELVPTPVDVDVDGQLVRSGPLLFGVFACVFDEVEGAGLAGAADGLAGVGAAKPCAKLTEPLATSRTETRANCFKCMAKLLRTRVIVNVIKCAGFLFLSRR
jgi:hypothetical protein